MTQRIALLVDGDNISAAYAGQIMQIAARIGRVDIARVYGNAQAPSGWPAAASFRFVHAGTGKNATNLLLTIDAMELALTAGIEGFVLVSPDGDFSHLSQRLKEHGLSVAGIGEAKAPPAFRAACTSFHLLARSAPSKLALVKSGAAPVQPQSSLPKPSDLDCRIQNIIAENRAEAEGITISGLSCAMQTHHQVRISKLPEKTWRRYLLARPDLFEVDAQGPNARVRLKHAVSRAPLRLVKT